MAVLFSAVTVTAGEEETHLFVGGIPREYDDLEGWTIFEDFLSEISEDIQVNVHVEAYLYGAEETYKATPEEVAYFMKRMEMDENFLRDHCDCIENADFSFQWSPEELFGLEIN